MTCDTASTHFDHLHTQGGLHISRRIRQAPETAVGELLCALDARRGLLLASSYEYPGRYKRYDLGFVDPPLAVEGRGREFLIRACNRRGAPLLAACEVALRDCPALERLTRTDAEITGCVRTAAAQVPEEERTRSHSIFSVLRALMRMFSCAHDEHLGLYGAFGYDLVFQLDNLVMRHARAQDARDLVLYFPDSLLVIDHERGTQKQLDYEFSFGAYDTSEIPAEPVRAPFVPGTPGPVTRDHAPGAFARVVERARHAFAAGDLFEATPSQVFSQPCAAAPSELFRALQAANPAPYGFCANLGAGEFLIGASPEMYVRVKAGRVETSPIAGTIARGRDAFGDAAQILSLLNSEKDTAELTMCTDVDRNDKARICEPGSVRVIGRRQIELYSRLIHTVDHVEGRLRPGYDALDALLTHAWAVTVTGAPKLDAMQFIEDHEQSARGYYGGAIGALHFDGSLNTGLVLRTIALSHGNAHVRAGATLHFDSDPEAEARECELKASAMLSVLERAHRPPPQTSPARSSAPAAHTLRVLMIDHRDSFVHTLADYFRQIGCTVTTLRHGFDPRAYAELAPELVVLSPGPARPDDFAMRHTLRDLRERALPAFGVCLGLQGMVEFCGGRLGRLDTPVHGKPSRVVCRPSALFRGLPREFQVGRYHSLYAPAEHLPHELLALAHTDDACLMAVAHRTYPWTAVQFHPESLLSDHGLALLRNVVRLARERPASSHAV